MPTMARQNGRSAAPSRGGPGAGPTIVAPAKKQPDLTHYSGRLAARIRELREGAGLSIEQFAERMVARGYQIAGPTIYHWENGQRQPQLDAIPTLAKVFKMTIGEFLPPK